MQNKLFTVLFVITAAIGLTSCSSDENSNEALPISYGTFTVSKNTQEFNATIASANFVEENIIIEGAITTNHEIVKISIPGTTTGTYTNCSMTYTTLINGVVYTNINPSTGQINGVVTITSVSGNTISGTFSFIAYSENPDLDPIVFESGFFNELIFNSSPFDVFSYASAFVDGNYFFYHISHLSASNGYYYYEAYNYDMQSFTMHLPQDLEPGIYPINSYYIGISIDAGGGSSVNSNNGYLTLLKNSDGEIEGTFYYLGSDWFDNSHVVTGGKFKSSLQ